MAESILIGQGESPCGLLLSRANRHGLIAGATGTGKTVTLQVLAEAFSRAGVPVFCADIKGDLAGISQPGTANPKIEARAAAMGYQADARGLETLGKLAALAARLGDAVAVPVARGLGRREDGGEDECGRPPPRGQEEGGGTPGAVAKAGENGDREGGSSSGGARNHGVEMTKRRGQMGAGG
jgi:hypothetical protein